MHISERLLVQARSAAKQPRILNEQESAEHHTAIAAKLRAQNAVLVAHCYYDPVIQVLVEETGGYVSDSLKMARSGNQHSVRTVVVAGMHFIGRTTKILNPEKRVLTPTLEAACSLDLGCPVDGFSTSCDQHSEQIVVVYANTSTAVKVRADWAVTPSYAVEIVGHLVDDGELILRTPDQHLGRCIQRKARVDMLSRDDTCIVHEGFRAKQLEDIKALYPDTVILVRPELSESVVVLADAVGSISQLVKAAQTLPDKTFIVTTNRGIFYKTQQLCPDKDFIEAPTIGSGAACRSCAHYSWMVMNTLEWILACLYRGSRGIFVDPALVPRTVHPLKRMPDSTQVTHLHRAGSA